MMPCLLTGLSLKILNLLTLLNCCEASSGSFGGTLLFVVGRGRASSSCFLLSFPFAIFFFMGLLVTAAGRRVIARRGEVELLFLIHFLFDFYFFLLLPPLYYVYEMGPLGYSFLLLQPLLYRYYQSICPLHLWEEKNDGEA